MLSLFIAFSLTNFFTDHKNVVQALIELGARLNVEDRDKKTPRQLAVEKSNVIISYEILLHIVLIFVVLFPQR